jgi:hypothetical protein
LPFAPATEGVGAGAGAAAAAPAAGATIFAPQPPQNLKPAGTGAPHEGHVTVPPVAVAGVAAGAGTAAGGAIGAGIGAGDADKPPPVDTAGAADATERAVGLTGAGVGATDRAGATAGTPAGGVGVENAFAAGAPRGSSPPHPKQNL